MTVKRKVGAASAGEGSKRTHDSRRSQPDSGPILAPDAAGVLALIAAAGAAGLTCRGMIRSLRLRGEEAEQAHVSWSSAVKRLDAARTLRSEWVPVDGDPIVARELRVFAPKEIA